MASTSCPQRGRVIALDAETCAFDTIYGFRLGHDRLAFTDGFFAPMTAGVPMAWRLRACHGAGGRALLAANTAQGWRFIADFTGIDRTMLAAAIADGRLLAGGAASRGVPSPAERERDRVRAQPQPWNTL
jgi:hypothetical protein